MKVGYNLVAGRALSPAFTSKGIHWKYCLKAPMNTTKVIPKLSQGKKFQRIGILHNIKIGKVIIN